MMHFLVHSLICSVVCYVDISETTTVDLASRPINGSGHCRAVPSCASALLAQLCTSSWGYSRVGPTTSVLLSFD